MAAALVQAAVGSAFSGTTVSATLSGVTAGNMIRVAVMVNPNPTTVSVSDGTAYSAGPIAASGNAYQAYGFYRLNVNSGSHVITATVTGVTIAGANILAEEWSGSATASAYDNGAAAFVAGGGSTHLQVGAFVPTTDGDDIWCALFTPNGSAPTVGSGFSIASNGLDSGVWFSEHLTQATATSINPDWTSGATAFSNYLVAMALKAPASATALLGAICL